LNDLNPAAIDYLAVATEITKTSKKEAELR
jgi:hypothetical protein